MKSEDLLGNCTGFDWDQGNLLKNWEKHEVSGSECEQIFFNKPLVVGPSEKKSEIENRYFVLGKTDIGRQLFLVFTIRKQLIRVISARDMSRKERKIYEDHE
jgi:uncharacterized DUF497 family protein